MTQKFFATLLAGALILGNTSNAFAYDPPNFNPGNKNIHHVLLISIDGMHAVDNENCVNGVSGVYSQYCPNLASLGAHGVNYTRTSASKPSDSFPGLMALVTGASPRSHGAFYDVAYDRVLAPPSNPMGTWNGLAGGTCTAGKANGTTTEYEEGVEHNPAYLNGWGPGGPYSTTDGGILSIDPTRLPRDPHNNCAPVYPWQFIRTNSIYGVIHAAGGYTAWSDKHAVYAAVSGHGNSASNVDDYYSPEINSNVISLPGVTTAGLADNCNTAYGTGAWVDDFTAIRCYDQLKVNAIVNEINGKTHDGSRNAPVPALFGMNFQAVSVGQKLIEKIGGVKVYGGYTDAAATPTTNMLNEIEFVDASIGQMVAALKSKGLMDSTLIIITAKHGQSPIDNRRFVEPPTTPATVLALAGMIPDSESPLMPPGGIGPTEDDISQLWLAPGKSLSAAVTLLENNAGMAGIGQIFYGPSLETMFNAPGLPPNGDPRTPDIIVQPNVGIVYSGSSKKQAEHGGFAHDDTNVMMLVSNPSFEPSTINAFVETMQVAPTILQALGLDPNQLDGVKWEGTVALPGLDFDN